MENEILKYVREKRDGLVTDLAKGQAGTYPEYREYVGLIKAYTSVLNHAADLEARRRSDDEE